MVLVNGFALLPSGCFAVICEQRTILLPLLLSEDNDRVTAFEMNFCVVFPDGLNIIIFYMNGRAHGKDPDIEMFIVLLLGIKFINFIG